LFLFYLHSSRNNHDADSSGSDLDDPSRTTKSDGEKQLRASTNPVVVVSAPSAQSVSPAHVDATSPAAAVSNPVTSGTTSSSSSIGNASRIKLVDTGAVFHPAANSPQKPIAAAQELLRQAAAAGGAGAGGVRGGGRTSLQQHHQQHQQQQGTDLIQMVESSADATFQLWTRILKLYRMPHAHHAADISDSRLLLRNVSVPWLRLGHQMLADANSPSTDPGRYRYIYACVLV
jgi:hypothetical protein